MKKFIFLIAVAFAVASCGGGGSALDLISYDKSADYAYEGGAESFSRSATMVQDESAQPDKKIIKTGRMGLDVTEIAPAKAAVDETVARYGGYYSTERFNDGDYRSTYTLSIRVPERNYADFIAALESGEGRVAYKEIDSRDVTERYLDLEMRLDNKRSYLQRYRDLLKRAGTIKEILEIEEQIRQLEEEIESAEGSLRYLDNQVSYSTLDLTLTQDKDYKYTPAKREKFWELLKGSLADGWRILKAIVLFLFKIWPVWVIGGGVAWAVLRADRRRKKRE